jgi:hypothetical protein
MPRTALLSGGVGILCTAPNLATAFLHFFHFFLAKHPPSVTKMPFNSDFPNQFGISIDGKTSH